MEWAKIPTDLLMDGLKDWELTALLKYTLLYAQKEYKPERDKCLRIMSEKQYEFALAYADSISSNVESSIRSVDKKRTADKVRYRKNKASEDNSGSGTTVERNGSEREKSSVDNRSDSYKEIKEKKERQQAIRDLEQMKASGKFPPTPIII